MAAKRKHKGVGNAKAVPITLTAIEGPILNTRCYRGFAPLKDLAAISTNAPLCLDEHGEYVGIQRKLSPKRAREAYEYARNSASTKDVHLWPEVILNVRPEAVKKKALVVHRKGKAKYGVTVVRITIHTEKLGVRAGGTAIISRVDGNHRLHFAGGVKKSGMEPLDAMCPFCLTEGLSEAGERTLFSVINSTQQGVRSDLLQLSRAIETSGSKLRRERHDEWLTEQMLASDLFGGYVDPGIQKKERGKVFMIKRTTLSSAHKQMLKEAKPLLTHPSLSIQKEVKIVTNFWSAVRQAWPGPWNHTAPKKKDRKYFFWGAAPFMALGKLGGFLMAKAANDLSVIYFARALRKVAEAAPDLWAYKDAAGLPNEFADLTKGGGHGASQVLFDRICGWLGMDELAVEELIL